MPGFDIHVVPYDDLAALEAHFEVKSPEKKAANCFAAVRSREVVPQPEVLRSTVANFAMRKQFPQGLPTWAPFPLAKALAGLKLGPTSSEEEGEGEEEEEEEEEEPIA